jgi:hypothetical protein
MYFPFPGEGIDLDALNFEEFVGFVFDHPTRGPRWYFSKRWRCYGTPERVLEQMTRLFQEPGFLLSRYTKGQLHQGFWYIGSLIRDMLWDDETDEEIDWPHREACILAMVSLEEKLFATEPLDDTCFMWWDFFRYFGDEPQAQVIEAMLIALERTLALPFKSCQESALHGLGHTDHPRKAAVIAAYLNANPDLPEWLRDYAKDAMAGNVL